jgi:hypothetical protein
MTTWADLESTLAPEPEFPVEQPDGVRMSELDRQAWLVAYIRKTSPKVLIYANANAGKRGMGAQRQAHKEGLLAGVPDLTCAWSVEDAHCDGPTVAWLEMKGIDARGAAGKLSAQQIETMNRLHRSGQAVACFFSAKSAIAWLRSLGCPIKEPVT